MNFLRLHNSNDNTILLLPVSEINLIDSEKQNGRFISKIYTNAMPSGLLVNETPESLFEQLRKISKNFIRLHNLDQNTVLVCNKNIILLVDTEVKNNDRFYKVYVTIYPNGLYVNETTDKIYALLNK